MPTFSAAKGDVSSAQEVYHKVGNEFVLQKSNQEQNEEDFLNSSKRRLEALMTASGEKAKLFLRQDSAVKAAIKRTFLPDQRSSMIRDDETEQILKRSFEYMVTITEFILKVLDFQLKYYLIIRFKEELSKSFQRRLIHETDWATIVEPDSYVAKRIKEVDFQIVGVQESLREVERLARKV